MNILVVSSSLNPRSRSELLARRCVDILRPRAEVTFITLKEFQLMGAELHSSVRSRNYSQLRNKVLNSEGIVLGSPIYNWALCSELKKFIEVIGNRSADARDRGAFSHKIIAFVASGSAEFSYASFIGLAASMILDYRCVISPYPIYSVESDWDGNVLSDELNIKMTEAMEVFYQLVSLLKARTYL